MPHGAAGGLVLSTVEARHAVARLRHETLTEAERLDLLKTAYAHLSRVFL